MLIGVTGHRPNKLLHSYNFNDSLRKTIRQLIYNQLSEMYNALSEEEKQQESCFELISGMAIGFDIDCAASLLKLCYETKNDNIHLIAVIPDEKQASKWSIEDHNIWRTVINKARLVVDVSQFSKVINYNELLQERNKEIVHIIQERVLVGRSGKLLYLWDGNKSGGTYNCLKYAYGKVECIPIQLGTTVELALGYKVPESLERLL